MFIVITGNVIDGLTMFGPFSNAEDANEYGDLECGQDTWVVATLYKPEITAT